MSEIWTGRRVLVTGHTGFKGTWLTTWLQELGAEVFGLALEPEHGAGIHVALRPWRLSADERVDVSDLAAVHSAVARAQPEVVFHLAAQPLVRRSWADPVGTYAANVMGTAHLLQAIDALSELPVVAVVTSDKVYDTSVVGPYQEGDPLGGHDPYSASKACCELVVRAWRQQSLERSARSITLRAGNVIGGGDRSEDRLVPDAVRSIETGEPLRIRNPMAVRPWQHVLEPLSGYLAATEHLLQDQGTLPPSLNFGPGLDAEIPAAELVERFFRAWGAGEWVHAAGEHQREVSALRIDSSLARSVLPWEPRFGLDEAIGLTVAWYRAQGSGHDLRAVTLSQLHHFCDRRAA